MTTALFDRLASHGLTAGLLPWPIRARLKQHRGDLGCVALPVSLQGKRQKNCILIASLNRALTAFDKGNGDLADPSAAPNRSI